MTLSMLTISKRDRLSLFAILLLVFVIRVASFFVYPQPIDGDGPGYDILGKNFWNWFLGIKNRQGNYLYPAAHRTPLYPLFLHLIYSVAGQGNYIYVYFTQAIMDVGSAVLIFVIAFSIFGKVSVGLLSAIGFALYPTFILNTGHLYTETLFTFLLCAAMFAMISAFGLGKARNFFLSGIFVGLATSCRPVTLLYPLLVALLIPVFSEKKKIVPLFLATFFAGFLLVLSPWIVRNYLILKNFVPGGTMVGDQFFYSRARIEHDDFLGETNYVLYNLKIREIAKTRKVEIPKLSEVERDRFLFKETIRLISRYPSRYLLMCINGFMRVWFNVGYGYSPSPLAYLVMAGQLVLLVLFLVPFVFFRGDWIKKSLPVLLVIGYFILVHSLVSPVYRYIVPVMPLVIIFCSYATVSTFVTLHSRLSNNRKA